MQRPLVTSKTEIVYISEGGRRMFTRNAAYARTAIERIIKRRPCPGHGEHGRCRSACGYDQNQFDRLVSRYARALRRADNQLKPVPQRRTT